MQPYQYKPLPSSSSIRILIFHPAADTSSALVCDIITNDRLTILRGPENKTFDAVSYVWGNGAHDIPLYCKHEGTYLYISAVVDEMLRSLRKCHRQRRLWIDAICLNQKDNQEKSIQVQQMGQIYHMADKVQIWLGPADATTPLAFAFLRTLVARFEPLPGKAKDPTTQEVLQTFEETFQHRNFQSFLGLLRNSWFTRRWTLQEGFLARDAILRCGNSKISWHWFTEGLKLIRKRSEELKDIQNDHTALYALNVLEILRKPEDLLSLLWTLHMSQCSDHRDRIYSLLGLAKTINPVTFNSKLHPDSNSNQELPIPDYALGVDAAFRNFASHCISTDRQLEILLHIDGFGRLSEANPEWPSWVPNWTKARDRKLISSTAMSMIMLPSFFPNKEIFFKLYCEAIQPLPKNQFLCIQPTVYSNHNIHGLIVYAESFRETIKICGQWPESNDVDNLVRYLADWIHEKAILYLPDQEFRVETMHSEVISRILLLVTGSDFFGYARYNFLRKAQHISYCNSWVHGDDTWGARADIHNWRFIERFRQIADLIYPIAREPGSFTLEQVHQKEHLDDIHNSNLSATQSRQDLLDLLEEVSRMMREGNKRLIAASCDGSYGKLKRRHWIAPSDIRMGDVITNVSHCGRIGMLLRPIDSPSELKGRPVFEFVGILWSLEDISFHRPLGERIQPEEFLIL